MAFSKAEKDMIAIICARPTQSQTEAIERSAIMNKYPGLSLLMLAGSSSAVAQHANHGAGQMPGMPGMSAASMMPQPSAASAASTAGYSAEERAAGLRE